MDPKLQQVMALTMLLLLIGYFPSSNCAADGLLENSQFQVENELVEKAVRRFKLEYHRDLEAERIRRKRDAGLTLSMVAPQDNKGEHLSIRPSEEEDLYSPLQDLRVSCWTWIQPDLDSQSLLLFIITDEGHLVLVNYENQQFNRLFKLTIKDIAYKARVFVSGPHIWLTVAFRSRESGRHYIQLYRYNGMVVHLKQAIPLDGRADFALIYNRGYWYMATATFNKLTLYEWRHTQYDEVAATSVVGISSLAVWRASGSIYIATAVGTDRGGSPLFQYRRNKGQLSRLQILPVHSSNKVVKFKVDGNDYLLFLCRDFAVIYWRSGNAFLEYQVLSDSAGAIDADVLLLPNHEAAIALAFKKEIRFYVEGFSSEYSVSFSRYLEVELSSGFGFFYQANLNYFLMLTFNLSSFELSSEALGSNLPQNVWKLSLNKMHDMQPSEDPLTECLGSLKAKLADNSRTLDLIEANYGRVLVTNKEQRIQAQIVVLGKVEVKEGLKVEQVLLQAPEELPVVPQITNGILRGEVLEEERDLGNAMKDMDNLAYKSQDQIINGNIMFLLPFEAGNLQLTSLTNDVVLNEVPLSVLAEGVLKTQGEQTILHHLHVSNIETNDLYLDGVLNGIKPQDAVLLHQDERITSELHFTNVQAQDINLQARGSVNDLQLSLFVTANVPQVINGMKTFHNLVVHRDVTVRGQTNQHDLSVFVKNVMHLDNPPPKYFDQVEFSAPISVDGDVYVHGLINGIVDLQDLSTRALDLSSEQIITGRKAVSAPVFVNGDVFVDGTTNGVDVSQELFTLSTDQYIPGTVSFETLEILGDLTTGTVNGYDLETEVARRENQQGFVINGHKTFKQSLQVLHDVNMRDGSMLNGLDLSDLVQAATRTDNVVVLGATSFQSLVIQQVIASDSINGIAFDHLYNNVWRKSTDQDILVPVQFFQPITMEQDLEITRNMNGYDLAEDFVHVYGDEEISGYVHFTDTVYIHGSLQVAPGKKINDIDISEYNHTMVPSQQESIIHSHVVFPSLEVKGNLIVVGTINGARLDDMLQVNKEQVFTGHVTLQSNRTTVSGDLKLDSLFLERDINNVDFSEFNKHVVYDHDLGSVMNKDFIGGLVAESLVSEGTLNGFDLDAWFMNAVRLSTESEISGFKRLSELVFLGGLTVDTLNDVSLSDHLSSIVMGTADHVRGSKTIQGSVTVNGDLTTKGLLNNVNLPQLESVAAYADADNIFKGLVVIDGNLEVDVLSLGESATLDGLLWSHLVFVDQNHAFHGTTTFPEGVTTTDATVRRLINGCDIIALSEQAIYLGEPFPALEGTVSFRTLTVHGDLDVSGLISGVHLTSLAQMMLRKSGQQTVTGATTFTDLQADSVQLGLINGLDFSFVMEDAVVQSRPQTIMGVKKYVNVDGVAVLNDLLIMENVVADGTINGIDLSVVHEMSLLKTNMQEIRGFKTFNDIEVRGNVFVQGLINGVSVPSEMILLETDEEINLPVTFKSESSVMGQVHIGHHLDGVNFQQFIGNRVTLLHNQYIYAEVEFQDTLETDNLVVLGSINDVPVTDIVLRHNAVHLSGQKTFENSVTIAGNLLVHELNHIDLVEFSRDVVRINQAQEISHVVEFVSEIEVQNDLVIEESINDIRLAGLEKEFADYNAKISETLRMLHEEVLALDGNIELSQKQLLAGEFWELLHFQPFQTIEEQLSQIFLSPSQDLYILDVTPNPVHARKLLGWLSVCEDKGCCSVAKTHVFDIDGTGHLTASSTEPGHLFYLFGEAPLVEDNLHGFVLWTNATRNVQMCPGPQAEAMSIISVQEDQIPDLSQNLHPMASPTIQDVKLFKAEDELHLVISYVPKHFPDNTTAPSVLRYNRQSSSWVLLQLLRDTGRTTSLSIGLYTDKRMQKHLLIALTNHLSLFLYRWTDRKRFDLVTKIPVSGVTSSLWIEAQGTLFLMLALTDARLLNIYTYSPDGSDLAWFQTVEHSGINALHGFHFSGETFVAISSLTTQDLSILQLRGQEGFTLTQRHPIPGITDITSYWSTDGNFFLAVTSECGLVILKAVAYGFGSRH